MPAIEPVIESARSYRAGFPPETLRPAADGAENARPEPRTEPSAATRAEAAGAPAPGPTGTLPGDDAGSILDVTG